MEAVIRVPLTFTGSASERDSGDYNCTAVNGGSFFPDGLTVVLGPSAVATTRSLQVVVLGKNADGPRKSCWDGSKNKIIMAIVVR